MAKQDAPEAKGKTETAGVTIHVAPSPHLSDTTFTTRRMMLDVLIGLTPAMLVAVYIFRVHALIQIGSCVAFCALAEFMFTTLRGKKVTLGDGSAVVTGVILGMSLPWSAPWYTAAIGSFVGMGLGKVVFGGLGFNIFNPAMVGRAFIMLSFAKVLGAPAYVDADSTVDVLTQATPLTAAKNWATAVVGAPETVAPDQLDFMRLFLGNTNGSIGEVSALALLLGGIYLCWRRSASWEIPAGVGLAVVVCAGLANVLGLSPILPHLHLAGGALMLGAFFIATDPVTSPLTPKGKFLFGLGVGALIVLLRLFSSYPEGVMFAVLIMNALAPLINQWTIPKPVGGPMPVKK